MFANLFKRRIMKKLMKGMMYAAMVCILVMMSACGDGPTLSKHKVQALDLTTQEKDINEDLNEFAVDMLREVGSLPPPSAVPYPLRVASHRRYTCWCLPLPTLPPEWW